MLISVTCHTVRLTVYCRNCQPWDMQGNLHRIKFACFFSYRKQWECHSLSEKSKIDRNKSLKRSLIQDQLNRDVCHKVYSRLQYWRVSFVWYILRSRWATQNLSTLLFLLNSVIVQHYPLGFKDFLLVALWHICFIWA